MRSFPFYILWLFLSLPLANRAQIHQGFTYDNYGGVHNVVGNPANSVESKYKFHINAISYNKWNLSDFGAVDLLNIETKPNGFNGLDFKENKMNPTNQNNLTANSDVMLPSVIWGFHPKHAAGLIWRSRSFTDYQGFNGNLWTRLNGSDPIAEGVSGNSNFNNTVHQWDEVGLNYATVLLNSNYHFLKFGGTIKYLSGRGGVELRGNIDVDDAGELLTSPNSTDLLYVNTFSDTGNFQNNSEMSPFYSNAFGFKFKNFGVGGDVGLVYEWRPRETNRVGVRNSSSGVNTYKLRISAAILDLGTIAYGTKNNNIRKKEYTASDIPIATTSLEDFNTSLSAIPSGESNSTEQGSVSFGLPTALNIGLDYILFNDKNYYLNLNYLHGLTNNEDEYTNTRANLLTFTPRYETRDLSVYLPISYGVSSSSIHAGIGLRYKYITAGCAALNTFIEDKPLNHIYVGISLPILEEVFQ
ncbi:DUF5723 family protein [Maribacter chungangensis]|uniref:DUF5723 family protein n=1 Tax=Maribacter chungangensis TaxID=1069117 RepID=A0ABW3AYQ9_9FLAO